MIDVSFLGGGKKGAYYRKVPQGNVNESSYAVPTLERALSTKQ